MGVDIVGRGEDSTAGGGGWAAFTAATASVERARMVALSRAAGSMNTVTEEPAWRRLVRLSALDVG